MRSFNLKISQPGLSRNSFPVTLVFRVRFLAGSWLRHANMAASSLQDQNMNVQCRSENSIFEKVPKELFLLSGIYASWSRGYLSSMSSYTYAASLSLSFSNATTQVYI